MSNNQSATVTDEPAPPAREQNDGEQISNDLGDREADEHHLADVRGEHSVYVKAVPFYAWHRARSNALASGIPFRHYMIRLLAASEPFPRSSVGSGCAQGQGRDLDQAAE